MQDFFRKGYELLSEGRDFVYSAVIYKSGSVPSGVGARMIVLEDSIIGTIGGGGVEGDVIRIAREQTMKDRQTRILSYDLEGKDAAVSDFICGGKTKMLVYYVSSQDETMKKIFEKALEAERESKGAYLVYALDENEGAEHLCRIILSVENEGYIGEFEDSEHVKKDMLTNPARLAIQGEAESGKLYIVDRLTPGGNMIILGGGHVSKEVAKLAVGLDFVVTVVEDREEYITEERFPGCSRVLIDSFDDIPDIKTNSNTYILVITRGHVCDRQGLEWGLKQNYRYLGMIGSKKKRDLLYDNLRAKGALDEELQRVHCPIGLQIGAKTPAEIAVSVMAEIIALKYAD